MPAPIIKGVILLSSVLLAAGIAAYENPEVRAWFEERRRKIALTLNEIADEFDLERAPRRRRNGVEDASRREDNSAEAVERRSRARQEIMERGLLLDQKRRQTQKRTSTSSSFDTLVDSEGKLKEKNQATTTSIEQENAQNLRNRTQATHAVDLGSVVTDPFDDKNAGVVKENTTAVETQREQSTTTIQDSPLQVRTAMHSTATSVIEDSLTPTDSLTASPFPSDGINTPTSTTNPHGDFQEPVSQSQQLPPLSYQSIQEWASTASSGGPPSYSPSELDQNEYYRSMFDQMNAQNQSASSEPASFYSPSELDQDDHNQAGIDSENAQSRASSTTASIIGTNDLRSEDEDLGVEAFSDAGIYTPSSWSDVGSRISED